MQYYGQLKGKRKNALALIAKMEGFAYNYFTKYDSAGRFFDEAITLYTELGVEKDVAECYYGKGINYLYESNYAAAISSNFKSLAIYEKLKDSFNIYVLKTAIGLNYERVNEGAKALAIFRESLAYYLRHGDRQLIAYNQSLISQVYYQAQDYTQSIRYSQAALANRREMGDMVGISSGLNNLSAAYLSLKQWDKAVAGFTESLEMAQQLKQEREMPIIKQNIANCLWHLGRTQEAEQLLLANIDAAQRKKEEVIVAHGYQLLSGINRETKNYKAALDYYELYKAHNDSLFNNEKEKTIHELDIKYETNKKEAQIARLNDEKKIDNTRKLAYLLALVGTLIIAVLTILFLTSRNKKNKLEMEKVKLELEANTRELYYFTESIISKNKLIAELEQKLLDSELQAEKTSMTAADNEQLSRLYQLKILTEADWRNFKMLFDKVYPGYINRLREQYPDLAPAEERQFLLIKLKIDNKECADMLGISADSVKKNRYRLKKRFSLAEQDNLDEFVWNFNGSKQ